MNKHIDRTYKKAVEHLKLPTKTRTFLTDKAAITIYNPMILPLFTYTYFIQVPPTFKGKE